MLNTFLLGGRLVCGFSGVRDAYSDNLEMLKKPLRGFELQVWRMAAAAQPK